MKAGGQIQPSSVCYHLVCTKLLSSSEGRVCCWKGLAVSATSFWRLKWLDDYLRADDLLFALFLNKMLCLPGLGPWLLSPFPYLEVPHPQSLQSLPGYEARQLESEEGKKFL